MADNLRVGVPVLGECITPRAPATAGTPVTATAARRQPGRRRARVYAGSDLLAETRQPALMPAGKMVSSPASTTAVALVAMSPLPATGPRQTSGVQPVPSAAGVEPADGHRAQQAKQATDRLRCRWPCGDGRRTRPPHCRPAQLAIGPARRGSRVVTYHRGGATGRRVWASDPPCAWAALDRPSTCRPAALETLHP